MRLPALFLMKMRHADIDELNSIDMWRTPSYSSLILMGNAISI
jgi:hypothetical protein